MPARLDDVVMRALERDPAARWATAGDMLAALQRYLYSLDETPARATSKRWSRATARPRPGGDDPPRTLSYPIDLAPGDARDVFADFTHP